MKSNKQIINEVYKDDLNMQPVYDAIKLCGEREQEKIENAINKCESHSWEGHKCVLVEELKRRLKDEN